MADSFKSYFAFSKANRKIFFATVIYTLFYIQLPYILETVITGTSSGVYSSSASDLFKSVFDNSIIFINRINFHLSILLSKPLFLGIIRLTYYTKRTDKFRLADIFYFFTSPKKYLNAFVVGVCDSSLFALFNILKYFSINEYLYFTIYYLWTALCFYIVYHIDFNFAISSEDSFLRSLKNSLSSVKNCGIKSILIILFFRIVERIDILSHSYAPGHFYLMIPYCFINLLIYSVFYYFFFRVLTKLAEKILLEKNYIELPEYTEQA